MQPDQPPAAPFDLLAFLRDQCEWSTATFGPNYDHKRITAHIRKELDEIEEDPTDTVEWIDVVMMGLDGAWRSGATPEQIIETLVGKMAINQQRVWPDWRTADPDQALEHDRSHD